MTLRRFAGCLVSLTMLQFGLVRAEVCAAHTEVAAATADASHHGNHDTAPDLPPEPDCDMPAEADCCTAVASCSLTLSAPEAPSSAVPEIVHVAITAAPRGAPPSATAAPETPPPRV